MLHRLVVVRDYGATERETLKALHQCFDRGETIASHVVISANGEYTAEEVFILDDNCYPPLGER